MKIFFFFLLLHQNISCEGGGWVGTGRGGGGVNLLYSIR